MKALLAALVLLLVCRPAAARAPVNVPAPSPWLFVSDLHYDPLDRHAQPSRPGNDTNEALFASALAAMKRTVPDPPVVVIPGDFFSHTFPYANAGPVMRALAHRFDRAFPHAQFVIALGNEDSGCGDYQLGLDAPFLRAAAAAWEPLVNRRNAAPEFARTFAHDGFYTARLPLPGVRAVVIDDVVWAPRFRATCGGGGDAPAAELADLERALQPGGGERRWLLMHIPPGVDAASTVHVARGLAIVPFLDPQPRDRLLELLADPAHRVTLAIAGHTHKFAYRLPSDERTPPVPLLLVPSVSPIFRNAPSFLSVDVRADGAIGDVRETSYRHGVWAEAGSLHALGVAAFTARDLSALHARLARDPVLQAAFARMYGGGARPEISPRNYRDYACAATAFTSTAYRDCTGFGGVSVLTNRGLILVAGTAALGLAFATAAVVVFRRARRRPLT